MQNPTSKKSQLKKLIRFTAFYGFSRAFNKAAGRLRFSWLKEWYLFPQKRFVSVIGSGQFAFSSICYFLAKKKGKVFLDCYDVNIDNAKSLANYYGFQNISTSHDNLLLNNNLEVLYIVSNHSTHSEYAIEAMKKGVKTIHIEKPISTNYEQLVELIATQRKFGTTLFSGYNRPYSAAVKLLENKVRNPKSSSAFSVNYFISGHLIPDDHWYRNEEEGTRICGNMGHWLDLSIHILAWRSLPEKLNIQLTYSNLEESDDNITVNLTSEKGDLISIMLTSRTEPFEGINESVNFQFDETIAKIDDFRSIKIWQGEKLIKKRFFPKDVGHKRTVLQPFYEKNRDWQEVIISTLLMLQITDMVRNKAKDSTFYLQKSLKKLSQDISTQTEKNSK